MWTGLSIMDHRSMSSNQITRLWREEGFSCREGRFLHVVSKIYFLVLPKNFRNTFRDSGCLM